MGVTLLAGKEVFAELGLSSTKVTRVPKKKAIPVYRQWVFFNNALIGYSNFSWEPDKPTKAKCYRKHKIASPLHTCRCGLYGHLTPYVGHQLVYSGMRDYPVMGKAKIWGKVLGTPGVAVVRGQYGQIESLYLVKRKVHPPLMDFCDINGIAIEWI